MIVASDGLADNVHLEEMIQTIRKGPQFKAGEKLARLARDRMTSEAQGLPSHPDDMTFILFRRR